MIFLNINCWFGKCLKSDVCTDSLPFFCSHAAKVHNLHFHCHYQLEYNLPLPLKFQPSKLANKLRIWRDSSTFSTLPLHTTLCVSTVLSLYTSFMFFVFNWDTVWITLFCLTDDIDVRVFKFSFACYRFTVDKVLFFWLFWRLWDFKFLQPYPPFPPKLVLAQTVTVTMNFESILNSLYFVYKRLFKIFNI